MSAQTRVLVFFVSLMVAPGLWALGRSLSGDVVGASLAVVVVAAAGLYAQAGQPKPPAGTRPA